VLHAVGTSVTTALHRPASMLHLPDDTLLLGPLLAGHITLSISVLRVIVFGVSLHDPGASLT
jgi:hypothetical protein